ncbi:Dienelactone hydrolase family protein [Psychrobacillus sp. OK028]|uniref:alpha/beta hydrolase family protein n=1 Tax=Psychrobacillus sp. OK028 TaxID=1884359 RepID=UPI00088C8BD2|nr:dienelactone hydrolase family protein [Psychrobacillus sp. OK028]SDM39084.1 Dienelactone hydrolase family protein [Psychrobacillus sp. OK028]
MYTLQEIEKNGAPPLLHNVNNIEDWLEKKLKIQQRWLDCIGGLPPLVKPNMKINSWEIHTDHYLINISYSTVYEDRVPAHLLVPKVHEEEVLATESDVLQLLYSSNREPFRAVIALHPTSDNGKEDISTTAGRKNRQYGLELVKRGYVVLAPDTITAGERILQSEQPFQTATFYKSHPEWSAVAKMMVDHQQGISLLETLSIVDNTKMGAIGHSLGGYNSFFLAGVDSRIKAVICSCGFSPFAQDPEVHRWGRREWFSHIPKISDYINQGNVPFEFTEIAALVAPIPLFMWMGQNDRIFPHWEPAAKGLAELNSLYEWMEKGEQFTSLIGNSGHDFPPEIRQIAYTFLDKWLS